MKDYKFLLLATMTAVFPVAADWKETLNDALENTSEITGKTLDKTLDKTRQYSGEALEGSKDLYESLSDSVRPVPKTESIVITTPMVGVEKKEHLKEVWSDVLVNLDEALELNTKIDSAPDSKWFGEDKDSLGEDQVDVFAEIEKLLSSPGIARNRENIDKLKERIAEERERIAAIKEKKVFASAGEKAKLDKKIQKLEGNISVYNTNIDHEKNNLKVRLQDLGLLLSDGQIDVLLSRVDSSDIIKMSIVYDVLADITRQLMELTQEFNEDINQARKYYGMHVVLLKFVLNMQQSYLNKMDNDYLPKIQKIKEDTARVSGESKALLRSEEKSAQRIVLQNNIQAQELTLNVANLYAQQLMKQKIKVQEAQKIVKRDYLVAKNTFDTVKLSAELIRLMKNNQASFNALMNIQVPEIVPFKNIEMQKKFEELSILLREGDS